MLEYIDKLNEVDTSAVEPLAQIGDEGDTLRDDKTIPFPPRDEMMRNAPDRSGPFFRVPKVIGDR